MFDNSAFRRTANPESSTLQAVNPAPRQNTAAGYGTAPKLDLFDPEEFINDDPAFETRHAAAILGVPADRLMKWRQRDQGPDYLVYEDGGIRYELSALIAYKASRRICPSRQPRPGKRS